MSECMPCIVSELGKSVGMTPIAWWEHPDKVVIVFEQGPKLTFMRKVEEEPATPAPVVPPKKVRKPRKAKK
jgi:hypothetical protein